MNISDVKNYYLNSIDVENKKLPRLKKTIFIIATLRLSVVIIGAVLCYFLWKDTFLTICTAFTSAVIFFALLKYHEYLFYKKDYSLSLIKLVENEIHGLDYNFSVFDGAPEKIEAEHSFSYDLDLFGNRSFFQSINRTVTSFGKDLLADSLLTPLKEEENIIRHQKAIQELTNKQKLIKHFLVTGSISKKEDLNIGKFTESFSHKNILHKNTFWEIMTFLVPSLYLILLILSILKITSFSYFIPLWLVTFTLSALCNKTVNSILGIFEKKTDTLSAYSSLFQIIENEKFESTLLQETQKSILGKSKASQAIKKLGKLCSNLNLGYSYPVVFFFNPVLFWNVKYAIKIEKWLEIHSKNIPEWFNSLAKFDALTSLSIFAFNHPDYTYPQPNSNHFILNGKKLGHPLIHREKCVKNNVSIDKESYFLVITGANMAGKSTYLRTIGINHVLACTGAPVCAESLEFFPGNLVTNLRTTDSLADNESYFFSELKRLKMIINRLQSGEHLFIILDEILKGTNSEDKQKGSLALMKQLIALNGNGIIATHDLILGSLEKEYPENVKNYCFEADITNDKLTFSYQMREGIAQNMNACFLMKKMGITGL